MCHNKCEEDKCGETKTPWSLLVPRVDFKLHKTLEISVTRK